MATENNNDNPHEDQIGENAGDTSLEKGNTPTEHAKPDDERVHTVVPDNDSGIPGPPNEADKADGATEDSSNKDGGPSEENL